MALFENIEWRLIAEDKASAVFNRTAKAADNLNESSKGMAKSVNDANSSWVDIAKGVVAGGLALGVAQKGFALLKDAVVSGIGEAQEAERVQAQLAAAIESTGGAAGLTQEDLNGMASAFSDMAVGGGEAIGSLQGILLTFTNITSATFERTTQAALDLATSMNSGVLPTAEQLKGQAIQLGKALNDPTKGLSALTRVGVTFTEEQKKTIETMQRAGDVTAAQTVILEELAREFGGSAAAAAKTFQGRMVALNNTISDAKELIGKALLPTLSFLAGSLTDQVGKIKVTDDQMLKWQRRVYEVTMALKNVAVIIGAVGGVAVALAKVWVNAIQAMAGATTDLVRGILNLGKNVQEVVKGIVKAMGGDFEGALDTFKSLGASVFKFSIEGFNGMAGAMDSFDAAVSGGAARVKASLEATANTAAFDEIVAGMNHASTGAQNFADDMSDAASGAGEGLSDAEQKIKEALDKLEGDYQGGREKIATELMSLEKDHADNVAKIKERLQDLQTTLEETTAAYQKTMSGINRSEAEGVVGQEQKIADLEKQLAEAKANREQQLADNPGTVVDSSQIEAIEKQLAAEKKAYDDYIQTRKGLDAELEEARRRASLTDFQRFIEDTNNRRTEEQAAYDAKLVLIQGETAAQQQALVEEQAIYEAKKSMYAQVDAAFQAFHDSYLTNMQDIRSYTEESVAAMEVELQRIIKLFSEIQSIRSSAGLQGVSLDAPTTQASAPGQQQGSGVVQQVTNNITVQVEGDSDAAAAIVAEIQRQLQLANLGSQ